jgi:hypothetical protein
MTLTSHATTALAERGDDSADPKPSSLNEHRTLTDALVRKAKPKAKRYLVHDDAHEPGESGFALSVGKGGDKSYVVIRR